MKSILAGAALAGAITLTVAQADPIHRIENDAYWHHDSGWVFPERIGDFVREGAAQDVAGSRDAVAHYVRMLRGVRVVAAVDVFPSDSAVEQATLESARAALVADASGAAGTITDDLLPVAHGLTTSRVRFTPTAPYAPAQTLYFTTAGEWRVRIRVEIPAAVREVSNELDAFVAGQRWDTLATQLVAR